MYVHKGYPHKFSHTIICIFLDFPLSIFIFFLCLMSTSGLLQLFSRASAALLNLAMLRLRYTNKYDYMSRNDWNFLFWNITVSRNRFCSDTSYPHQINSWVRILVQVTLYRRLLIGRDGHLDQSEVYDIS